MSRWEGTERIEIGVDHSEGCLGKVQVLQDRCQMNQSRHQSIGRDAKQRKYRHQIGGSDSGQQGDGDRNQKTGNDQELKKRLQGLPSKAVASRRTAIGPNLGVEPIDEVRLDPENLELLDAA